MKRKGPIQYRQKLARIHRPYPILPLNCHRQKVFLGHQGDFALTNNQKKTNAGGGRTNTTKHRPKGGPAACLLLLCMLRFIRFASTSALSGWHTHLIYKTEIHTIIHTRIHAYLHSHIDHYLLQTFRMNETTTSRTVGEKNGRGDSNKYHCPLDTRLEEITLIFPII